MGLIACIARLACETMGEGIDMGIDMGMGMGMEVTMGAWVTTKGVCAMDTCGMTSG
jgi:hypothetical protein